MLCEEANSQLVEYAEGALPPVEHTAVEKHLHACVTCQSDYATITDLQSMSINWDDEQPPAWQIPELQHENPATDWLNGFRNWFPTFASATALVFVSVMYLTSSDTNGTLPSGQQVADLGTLPELPQAQQAAFVDTVLQTSREQRQEEFSALLEYITAEMNRRSIETEDSMRFILSSQIEGQKELDQLYQQIENLADTNTTTPPPSESEQGVQY